jgi:transcriptional regulator PpsR
MLAPAGQSIVGKPFPRGFDEAGMAAINNLLADTRTVGKGSISGVASDSGEHSFDLTASFVRQANETRFLVRLGLVGRGASPGGEAYLRETLQQAPDAVLQTDADGLVMAANQSFLDLAQLVAEEQARGRSADRWLGRSGVDLNVLLSNLRERGVVKLFASTLRGELGTQAEVEISACRVSDTRPDVFAFFIRDIGRRVATGQPSQLLPRSIEQVTDRVGRVPLKELVRESTDIIEAMCIEAALRLTSDNRASAAELLGLSRQSLYAKLRRYHIGSETVQR